METEDYINEYINREKQQEHNPYLATRIMEKIKAPKHKIPSFFQYTAVAASISIAVIMGIVIGDSYAPIQKNTQALILTTVRLRTLHFIILIAMNKIKILSWTVVALIVLNLTTIGTILYHNNRESTDKVVELNIERKNVINGKFFRQTLGFNQNQMQVFREANHEFRPTANKIIFSIDSLKNEMFAELKKTKSDTIKLNFLSRETGNLHAELKRETNRFYLKIKMVCTPEQLNKLQMDFSPLYKSESYNGDGREHKGNGNRHGNGF